MKKIAFNSPLHQDLIQKIRRRLEMSRNALAGRHLHWAKMEEQFMAYIPETDQDSLRKTKRQQGHPQFTTIEIPYSYAQLLASHTYYTTVFLSRNPIMQVQGRHGEAQSQEAAVESFLDYQINIGGGLIPLYIWMLDPGKYGLGVLGYYWDDEQITVSRYVDQPQTFLGVPIPGKKPKKKLVTEQVRGYQGARLYNVRPADFFPDPRVPMSQFQKGEFCSRYVEVGWNTLAMGAKDGQYFNIDELEAWKTTSNFQRVAGSPQMPLPNQNNPKYWESGNEDAGIVPLHEVYIRLVPSEWGLPGGDRVQLWAFTVAQYDVIISARPLGYYHDKFPFEVMEYEPEGYGLYKRSMLETIKPLNDTLTWLINTHFYNTRKAINDQLIVDPSRVMMRDLENPNPGRLIRLKPSAYGTDIRSVVAQLPVADVTKQHIADAQIISDMIQRVTGVNDTIMGMVNPGGRKTATEVRTSGNFGVNRLKTVCEYFSAMGFAPMTQQLIQVSQQMFDEERMFRIVGDQAQFGTSRYVKVSPDDITGFYDFVPVDGTMPIDRFAQVNLWQQLMGQMRNFPQIMAQYDFAKIFAWVAQLGGLKNINQFRIQVVPDEQAQQNAQAGNSIPLQAGGGVPPSASDPTAQNAGMEPAQIPGMGRTA